MRKKLFVLCILLSVLLCLVQALSSAEEAPHAPTVMLCLNCGKADAILIMTEGRSYLIDTGYRRTADRLLEMLRREGVTRLDGVFLTHCHRDHDGGLDALVRSSVDIGAFYAPRFCVDGIGSKHPMTRAAAMRGTSPVFLASGDVITVSDSAFFKVLGPTEFNKDNENCNSLVMSLVTADGSILLTGDMKSEEEDLLLSAGLLNRHDVLKVPFHGDNTASGSALLSAVQPKAAVISTSTAEEKDTPSPEVLYRLAAIGCEIYVTQNAGGAVRLTLENGRPTVRMESWD